MRKTCLLLLVAATTCQAEVTHETLPGRVEVLRALPDRLDKPKLTEGKTAASKTAPAPLGQRPMQRRQAVKSTASAATKSVTQTTDHARGGGAPVQESTGGGHERLTLLEPPKGREASGVAGATIPAMYSLKLSDVVTWPEMPCAMMPEAVTASQQPTPAPSSETQLPAATQSALAAAYQAYEAGRYQEAIALFEAEAGSLDAAGWEVLGWSHWQLGHAREALAAFAHAYRSRPGDGAARGLVLATHVLRAYPILVELQSVMPGPLDSLVAEETRQAIRDGHTRFDLDTAGGLRVLPPDAPATPRWNPEIELTTRHKAGAAGQGRLQRTGLRLAMSRQAGTGQLRIDLQPQHIDDGERAAQAWSGGVGWQHTDGHGLRHDLYLGRGLEAGVLPAPLIGNYRLSHGDEDSGWSYTLSRQQNEESSLALIGKRQGGARWGRVIEHALRLDHYRRWGVWQPSFSLGYAHLTGVGIDSNDRLSLYARMLRPLSGHDGIQLGPELYVSAFRRDLEGYAPGQGGYFSPALHTKVGALMQVQRTDGPWQWQTILGLGWAHTRRDGAADEGGWAGQIEFKAIRDMGSGWELGFNLGGRQSPDYQDFYAGIALRGAR